MLPLPPIPLHLRWRNRIHLGRDYYDRAFGLIDDNRPDDEEVRS